MALGVAEFTELTASTLRNYEPELFDNVTTKHPILSLIEERKRDETGREMTKNLELGENSSTGYTDDSGTFSSTVSDDIVGTAVYQWSDPLVSHVRLKFKDLKKNSGPEQIFDLLKTQIAAMEKAHRKKIARDMHAIASGAVGNAIDYTGTTQRQFLALDQVVSDAAYDADPAGDTSEPAFTCGGINATTQPIWQASRIESPYTSGQNGYLEIRKAFRYMENEVHVNTEGEHTVDAIVCGRAVFEEFEDSFDGKVQYDQFEKGEARFTQISHGGKIVRLDPDCPTNRAYFLSTPSLRFSALAGAFMEPQEAQRVPNSLDWVHPVASIMAFGTVERRANAVLLRPSLANGAA